MIAGERIRIEAGDGERQREPMGGSARAWRGYRVKLLCRGMASGEASSTRRPVGNSGQRARQMDDRWARRAARVTHEDEAARR